MKMRLFGEKKRERNRSARSTRTSTSTKRKSTEYGRGVVERERDAKLMLALVGVLRIVFLVGD